MTSEGRSLPTALRLFSISEQVCHWIANTKGIGRPSLRCI
jgi:hypothetical protein